VTNIPGAFLHANMQEEVHMLLEGSIAELMVKLDLKLLYLKLRPFTGYYKWHYSEGYCWTPL